MATKFASQEISAKYDRVAHYYDWIEGIPDLFGLRRLRRKLLRRASGKVLEVAVGTGKNLQFYPSDSRVTASDVSGEMLNVARKRAAKLPVDVLFLRGDAETLPFRDKSFDTVVSSLSTCTFPNPAAALREIARVCRTDGRILFLEHGRSDREWLGQFQDRHADQFASPLGCHWNREPLELVRNAGLKIIETKRVFFGVFHQIEAEPKPT
ncbi:MAG TPA: methyltransferase domain-containing protein [Candidatus Binatia bacterium]|nr:methyltransferase domain-containing protein [Candidatus Binatia bacterium]